MNEIKTRIFLSPLFLLGLFLLLFNDFYLKAAFGNFLTGKLSDIAGLFIFPLFFAAFLSQYKKHIYIVTALGFIFWKLSISQPAIDLWNDLGILRVSRVEDLTDLFALLVLPLSYFYAGYSAYGWQICSGFRKPATYLIIVLSMFAFTATSFKEDRSFVYGKKYDLNMTKEEFDTNLKKIQKIGPVSIDHFDHMPENELSYTFNLEEKYCESDIHVSMTITQLKEKTEFELLSLRFWCKEEPDESVEDKLLAVFEREVIDKLRQNGH